jgi:hypothetical protein
MFRRLDTFRHMSVTSNAGVDSANGTGISHCFAETYSPFKHNPSQHVTWKIVLNRLRLETKQNRHLHDMIGHAARIVYHLIMDGTLGMDGIRLNYSFTYSLYLKVYCVLHSTWNVKRQ